MSDAGIERPGRFSEVLLLAVLVPPALLWIWTGLAGALFGSGWLPLNGGWLAHALLALPSHLGDPRAAWPSVARNGLPGASGFYGALALLLLAPLTATAAAVRLKLRRGSDLERQYSRWARAGDVTSLVAGRWRTWGRREVRDGERLALGFRGHRLLRAEQRHALVVFGPPQSGKSSGLAAGALLEWSGPAVASSIKTDLLDVTIARRRQIGEVYVFDPFGLSGELTNTWSPLSGARTFDGALEVAQRLASAGELDQRGVEGGDFWTIAAEQRLAPLLFAAANSDKGVDTLVRWGYGQGEQELTLTLERLLRAAQSQHERRDAQAAYDAVAGFRAQPDRTRGSVEGTVQALLRAYRSTRVQRSAAGTDITAEKLLSGASTLYLVGDAKASRLLRPIFLALLGEVIDHAYRKANAEGGRLDRPLLLCLDELGNVAPLPNLAEVASTAPSHNIQLVSVFHDLAQARSRYGRQAETVINSHRARMLLPGVADLDTLRYFSGLIGEHVANEETRTTGPGYQTRSQNPVRRPLAAPEQLRQIPAGHALLLYGRLPPAALRLRMWFEDRQLRALAGPGQ